MGAVIDGVECIARHIIKDERGAVMHMLKASDDVFTQFGEVYFSVVNAHVIKAWKEHTAQTQRCVVVQGSVKYVLYDKRADSATQGCVQEVILNHQNYCLLVIPPGIIYGFAALDDDKAIIANCTDIPHHPDEGRSYDINDVSIPYSWR